MRGVQREAGAPRPASTLSTTGSSSRAEAGSAGGACFRRRLLALLAVPGLFTGAPGLVIAPTALLLGALGLFAAAPAAAQVPAAPTNLSVNPGDAELGMTWTAPSGTVTGYDVHYTSATAASVGNNVADSGSDPATAWVAVTRSGTTASQTISSLSNNTAYRVRVRATNSDGGGAWVFGSGTPNPTVTLSVDRTSVPDGENVTLTATLSSAQAGWVIVNLGNQAGTAHSSKYALGSSVFIDDSQTTSASPITITTNLNGQRLGTFRVFITGFQKQSNVGNLINLTPSSAPLTITITASENADLAALSATQAGSAGGSYSALTLSPSPFAAATTAYTATVAHATTHVKLRVRGKDTSSGFISGTPSFSLASIQTSLDGTTAQKTSTAVLQSDLDFGPIALSVGENPVRVRVTAQDGTTTKDYTVTVTREKEFKPTGLRVVPGNGKLDLAWTAPSGTVTGYDVQYTSATTATVTDDAEATGNDASAAWVAVSRSGTTASQTISSLSNGITYRVRVRAKNSDGNGDWVFGGRTIPLVLTTGTVWQATMTPVAFTGGFGCKNKNECDDQISNNSFTVGGASYHFVELVGRTSTPRFRMQLSANANSGFQGLKLCVGTQEYSFPSSGNDLRTSTVDPGLSTTPVQLRIGSSCALPATDATLSGLTASSSTSTSGTFTTLTLSPSSFAAATTAYTATVANARTHVKLTPTLNDSNATVKVGKGSSLTAVTSGSASGAIALEVGANNVVKVVVTAEDGSATKTYTVTVTREAPPTVSFQLNTILLVESEEDAPEVVVVELSKALTESATVEIRVRTGGTATENVDYRLSTKTLTFAAGETETTIEVTAVADMTEESDTPETFILDLVRPSSEASLYELGSENELEFAIVDDSWAAMTLRVTPGDRQLSLSWTGAPRVVGYDVHYTSATTSTVGNDAAATGNDASVAWVALSRSETDPPTRSQTIPSLSNGTTYRVRVRWKGDSNNGNWLFGTGTPAVPSTTTTTTTTRTPRPRDFRPSFGRASVPAQSYTEGTEITPLVLPEATGGNGRLFYALSPVLPEGLTLNRRVRRLSGTPTTPQAAREYTWTATDADGDAARITFTVTVVPDKPSFDNVSVPDQFYTEGTEITPLELPEATGGNNPLTYTLTPSPPNGLTLNDVTRRLSGSPISPQDTTRYIWTATDADGDEATLTFTIAIAVDPHRERIRVLARRALAEMARRAMSGALDTIGARFGAIGGSGLSLAGQPVSLESMASVADGVGMAVWNNQSLALGELLGESAFSLRLAATEEAGDGDINLEEEGPLWSVWGRGDLASFAGGREEETHYDGWLRSGWLGIDARAGRWVGGMALSHEQGQADYGATTVAAAGDRPLQGRLETSLTALYPYGRWRLNDGMELQGVVGVGWGEARHTPSDEQQETGTLSMKMASLGVRKSLPDVAGLDLALRADAAVTRIETGDGPEVIHNLSADSWRLRTGLEASRRFSLEGEAFLEPFLEAAARQDGGDGLEGRGVELAGGLRYGAPNVAVELRGRWLAAHSEKGAEEQGISLTARYGPGTDGQGLFFAMSPRWGAATGGAQALWGEDLPVLSTASSGNSGALNAQVGYGFALPQGGVLTPFAEVGLAGADSRRLRLGTRYAAAVTGLELAGERRESGDAAAEHALQLDVDLRF